MQCNSFHHTTQSYLNMGAILTGEFKEIMDEAETEVKNELKELREQLVEEQKAFKMGQIDDSAGTEVYSPEKIEEILLLLGTCKKCGDLKTCSDCLPEMRNVDESSVFQQIIEDAENDAKREIGIEDHEPIQATFAESEELEIIFEVIRDKEDGDEEGDPDNKKRKANVIGLQSKSSKKKKTEVV